MFHSLFYQKRKWNVEILVSVYSTVISRDVMTAPYHRCMNQQQVITGYIDDLSISAVSVRDAFRLFSTSCLTWIYFHCPSSRTTGRSLMCVCVCVCVCIDPHWDLGCWLWEWYTPRGQSNYPDSPLPMSVSRKAALASIRLCIMSHTGGAREPNTRTLALFLTFFPAWRRIHAAKWAVW